MDSPNIAVADLYRATIVSTASGSGDKEIVNEGACKKAKAQMSVAEEATDPQSTLRMCCFADILKCPGTHTTMELQSILPNWHLRKEQDNPGQ